MHYSKTIYCHILIKKDSECIDNFFIELFSNFICVVMSACCVPEATRSSPINSGVHCMATSWRSCLSPEKVRKALIQDLTETKTLKPVFKYGYSSQSRLPTPGILMLQCGPCRPTASSSPGVCGSRSWTAPPPPSLRSHGCRYGQCGHHS